VYKGKYHLCLIDGADEGVVDPRSIADRLIPTMMSPLTLPISEQPVFRRWQMTHFIFGLIRI